MNEDLHPSSTHPPLPPTTEDIVHSHLRLLRSRRISAATYHRLIGEHGTARAALDALPQIASEAGVQDYVICPEAVIDNELRAGRRARAQALVHGHAGYPAALMEIENAPPVLWAIGDLSLLARPMTAFTGPDNASALGTRTATALARDLGAAGHVIVAGLSRGIETAAHLAGQDLGTVAVHTGGVDVMDSAAPPDLAAALARTGLRLSEQPPGSAAQARHFPARCRLVAGLGAVCVVIEAALKSASLETARAATDLGRDVLAVPGHPFDARASGCNALIRDGATLIRNASDVIEATRPIVPPAMDKLTSGMPLTARMSDLAPRPRDPGPESAAVQDLHAQILRQLGPDPVAIDQLIRNLRARPDDLGRILTDLELGGQIRRHAGGLLSRCA